MKPEVLAKILDEALKPYLQEIDTLKQAFANIIPEVENSTKTKHELEKFIIERASEERDRLLRDRDSFRGEKGEKGDQGIPGLNGKDGAPGRDGSDGKDGRQGRDGINGKDGKDGINGKDGAPGKQGERGLPGRDGINGKDGRDGKDGINGKDGAPGKQGIQGERGLPGKDGKDGKDGAPGRDGINGKDGKDGIAGKDGAPGKQGIQGERGLPGRDGVDGRDGKDGSQGERGFPGEKGQKGDKGDRGETGFLDAVEPWREKEYLPLEIVTCDGALWQARRKTSVKPSYESNSWEPIVGGMVGAEWDGTSLKMTMFDGETITSPDLKGEKGDAGESIKTYLGYDETQFYRAGLDEVKHNGCMWRALKNGYLHKPGTQQSKEANQWIATTHRGPAGKDGKDADPEVVKELVMMELARDNRALLEMTVKQVDDFLKRVDFV